MKKIFKYTALLATCALAPATTSCDDFLDVIPMNDVVEENYWTEKADVLSLLYSCYSMMEDDAVMKRMFVWGELRSDNITSGPGVAYDLQQLLVENILETSSWLNWQSFYQVINRCNTVIEYAPKVAAIDPNYTENEAKANQAEATFIRTLAYFYLLRTFRDVPYTNKPSLNDNNIDEDYRLAATPFAQLLQQLIDDMEAVKNDALRLYPEESGTGLAANSSRVTTCAINALLADLYLWKGDYQQCIDNCNKVLDYKMERYEELKEEYPEQAQRLELWYEKYPLIMEQPTGSSQGSVYNDIFGDGNSFESIFELYFQNNQSQQNKLVSEWFGNSSNAVGQLTACTELINGVYENTNKVFKPTDCRVAEDIEERNSQYAIRKYARQSVSFTINPNNASTAPSVSGSLRSSNFSNWVIYRLTDVMLMKAEAEVEQNTTASTDDAFQLVSACYNRANNFNTASKDTLVRQDYISQQAMRELVLEERRRELMFEGKRWYDLVRYSLRHNDNTYLVNTVTAKQKSRVTTIALQLQDPNALFWPYLESEMDANPKLIQNTAYLKNEKNEIK